MKQILFIAVLALLAIAVLHFNEVQAVFAQIQQGAPVDKVTIALDRNEDQRLSAAELANAPEVLRSLDVNRDGQLTPEEVAPDFGPPQDRGPGGGRPGFGGPGMGGPGGPPSRDLVADFDKNENGRLDKDELALALDDIRNNPQPRRMGPGGPGRPGSPGVGNRSGPSKPGRKVTPSDVAAYPENSLYDESILRTVFIDIDSDTWEKDMSALKDYRVDIEAKVTVDNKTYEQVGLRFRGNSSFFTVGEGQKRSLNLTFDWADKKQNLYGYRTLNLLNSHADASYMRLVLYGHITHQYIPVPKANFVHVVINGESWGVYINEQQFNSDFTRDYFGAKGGRRWKSPPGPGGVSFVHKGDDKSAYSGYELKTKNTDEAWNALINVTQTLAEAKPEEFDSKVDEVLSIDRVLWFLAVDNVLLDMDGYYQRGADYLIYQEPKFGRFHILPYDNNETFRAQGGHGPGFGGGPGGPGGRRGGGFRGGLFGGPPPGGGPGGGPGGPPPGRPGGPSGPPPGGQAGEQKAPFDLDIFAGIDQPLAPFINKLFQNPAIKARYVAHVRTIRDQWMDWNTVSPVIDSYRKLIDDEIKQDTRKLTTLKAYNDGIGMSKTQGRDSSPGLKAFFKGRKAYLDRVPELKQRFPEFESVTATPGKPTTAGIPLVVSATIDANSAKPDRVFVYFASDRLAKFQLAEMVLQDGNFIATLPPQTMGKRIFYYCEARTEDKYLTTAFHPGYAEGNPDSIQLALPKAKSSPIVINEVLASNKTSQMDPQGELEDWIELTNVSDKPVDLSGMYLSDNRNDLLGYLLGLKFPAGTTIEPGGYLLVWADRDVDASGIHAGFKLSKSGEKIRLIDSDKNGNQILDELKFGKQTDDRSYGRTSDGKFEVQTPTPGKRNER